MKIKNVLLDASNNKVTLSDLVANAPGDKPIKVVYAHTDVVNDNGLKLNADSITVTREKYPLLFEHFGNRVEDVVGYIVTDGKPNEQGEFIGDITFYDTPQGQHAKKLWEDEVLNELSVSYYIEDYEQIDALNGEIYFNVLKALLKEVSIVSVGADRDTHEIDGDEPEEEPVEEPEDDVVLDKEPVEGDDESEDNAKALNALKLEVLKSILQ